MRKLQVKMSMSFDGFVCGPNGETDWIFKTGDEQSKAWALGQTRDTKTFFLLLMVYVVSEASLWLIA